MRWRARRVAVKVSQQIGQFHPVKLRFLTSRVRDDRDVTTPEWLRRSAVAPPRRART
jgi:hypothetical protein